MARGTLALDVAVAIVITAAALAIVAVAHPPDNRYPTRWEQDKVVEFQFDRNFPSGKFRDRVIDGAKQWNHLGQSLTFTKAQGGTDAYAQAKCGAHYQQNVITKRKLGGNTLGLASWCLFAGSSEMYSFQIAFDKNREWYKGKKKPTKGTWDVTSVATHEFGHAAGRTGHFGGSSPECKGSPPVHVMCPEVEPASADQRNTAKHDKHTFKGAY